jgi:hypothetical protein
VITATMLQIKQAPKEAASNTEIAARHICFCFWVYAPRTKISEQSLCLVSFFSVFLGNVRTELGLTGMRARPFSLRRP